MINLVLPKGSLETQTLALLEKADLSVKRSSDRDYNATISDPRISKVKILRPQEIPQYVADGYFDLGITGLDWVEETGVKVVQISQLQFAKGGIGAVVKIVLAIDKKSAAKRPADLPPYLRISTEYPKLTKRYFTKLGLPVKVYLSYGATEAKIPDIVDAIVDITETGTTLEKNGMKILDVLLESPTVLIANPKSYQNPQKRREIKEITTLILGALEANGKVLIKLNVGENNLKRVLKLLPALKTPTISQLVTSNFFAVESVVPKVEINLLIPKLKSAGASDIIELPITKVIK